MITLTRNNLTLSFSEGTIPAQGSSKVPIQFVNDETTYTGYIIQPNVGWFNGLVNKQSICKFENDIIYLPAEAFALSGVINLSIALIDPTDANHIEVTNKAIATVNPAPMGTVILPSQDTWQQAVQAFTETYLDSYTENTVQPILTQAQQAVSTANSASSTANQTSETINESIQNGDFIPDISATASQGQAGTQPQVTVTGSKENPIFNFTIPEANGSDVFMIDTSTTLPNSATAWSEIQAGKVPIIKTVYGYSYPIAVSYQNSRLTLFYEAYVGCSLSQQSLTLH